MGHSINRKIYGRKDCVLEKSVHVDGKRLRITKADIRQMNFLSYYGLITAVHPRCIQRSQINDRHSSGVRHRCTDSATSSEHALI